MLLFGPHQGAALGDIARREPEHCAWALAQMQIFLSRAGLWDAFRSSLTTQSGSSPAGVAAEASADQGGPRIISSAGSCSGSDSHAPSSVHRAPEPMVDPSAESLVYVD